MTDKTDIQWTDHTFNPWWGCLKVSPGCENCYALTLARRYGFDVWGPAKNTDRRTFGEKRWAEPRRWNRAAQADPTGGVAPHIPGRLVFCASMADVFEDHPIATHERPKLWSLIRETPFLTWQLLTKRPENIALMLPDDWGNGYPNVWLGTSIESPDYAWRFDALRENKAAVYFLSLEPLIADVSVALREKLAGLPGDEIWWAIVGGESGAKARPLHLEWVRAVLHWCGEFGVWPFVKQLGAVPYGPADRISARRYDGSLGPNQQGFSRHLNDAHGGDISEWPEDLQMREFPNL